MKRSGILFVLSAFVLASFIQMNISKNAKTESESNPLEEYKFPKKVKAIIDKSCYGCHSVDGKSDDAKDALRWDKMHEYDKAKLVSVMDDIIEVTGEKKMPPKKFLEKKPDWKPTDKEYQTLSKWADKEAGKLLK